MNNLRKKLATYATLLGLGVAYTPAASAHAQPEDCPSPTSLAAYKNVMTHGVLPQNCHFDDYSAHTQNIVPCIQSHYMDVDQEDKWGRTLLTWSLNMGENKIAKLLIENGANVNLMEKWGCTPFSLAIQSGNLELTSLIFKNGANMSLIFEDLIYKECSWGLAWDMPRFLVHQVPTIIGDVAIISGGLFIIAGGISGGIYLAEYACPSFDFMSLALKARAFFYPPTQYSPAILAFMEAQQQVGIPGAQLANDIVNEMLQLKLSMARGSFFPKMGA